MVAFCPFLKNLPEVKFKTSKLTSLAEEISSQPNTKSVVQLLGIIHFILFLQVYNEEKQIGQKEIQNVEFGQEKDTGKVNVKTMICAGRETLTVEARSAVK